MFKAGQSKTLIEEFKERRDYKQLATTQFKEKVLDTWYQYPNYGFLNESFQPIVTNAGNDYENLSNFGAYADRSQRALPFVVKAFEDFRSVFLERAQSPNFDVPSYFAGLAPVKAHEDYSEKYKEYIETVKQAFSESRTGTREQLLATIITSAKVFPITQSGFSLSSNCPISTTGLSIELMQAPYDKDDVKGQVLNADTYGCFVTDAYNSGFYIDKNNPWRLIANLSSPRMRMYISQYKESTTPENVLDRFFRRKTQYEDMQSVYSFFTGFGSGFSLTTEELISYTIKVRMAEVGIPEDMYPKINKEAQDIFLIYGNNYAEDYLKGPASIIGKYCSEHLKALYEKKAKIDSFRDTTLKDLT
jgi:hypothetical protein